MGGKPTSRCITAKLLEILPEKSLHTRKAEMGQSGTRVE